MKPVPKLIVRNVAAALFLFVFAVVVDYVSILRPPVEVEFLVTALSFAMYLFVPVASWWANRWAFAASEHGAFLRLVLTFAVSLAFVVIALVPYLYIHTLLGGQM